MLMKSRPSVSNESTTSNLKGTATTSSSNLKGTTAATSSSNLKGTTATASSSNLNGTTATINKSTAIRSRKRNRIQEKKSENRVFNEIITGAIELGERVAKRNRDV